MNHKSRLLAVLLVLMAATTLSARTAKIIYFKAPSEAPKNFFLYQNVGDPVEVDIIKDNFSKTIELSDGDVKLYFLPEKLSADDEGLPKNAPSAVIPEAWEKVLIFAFHDPSNKVLPIKFKVVNANSSKLALGDLMFVNATGSNVFGMVGSKKLALKAKASVIVKAPASYGESYYVKVNREDAETNKTVSLIRQFWRQSAKQSLVVIVYRPPGTKTVTYYTAPVRRL